MLDIQENIPIMVHLLFAVKIYSILSKIINFLYKRRNEKESYYLKKNSLFSNIIANLFTYFLLIMMVFPFTEPFAIEGQARTMLFVFSITGVLNSLGTMMNLLKGVNECE